MGEKARETLTTEPNPPLLFLASELERKERVGERRERKERDGRDRRRDERERREGFSRYKRLWATLSPRYFRRNSDRGCSAFHGLPTAIKLRAAATSPTPALVRAAVGSVGDGSGPRFTGEDGL